MKDSEENLLNQPSGSLSEQKWARVRALQDAILLHLIENGSMKWIDLYLHFNEDESVEIGSALGLLTRSEHIAVEIDTTTTITAAGRERLLNGK